MKTYKKFTCCAIIALLSSALLGLSGPVSGAEGDLYDFLWLDPDKQVFVLQNKIFKKKGKFFVNAGLGRVQGQPYLSSSFVHLKGGYYLSEQWALELLFNTYSHSESTTLENLRNINQQVPFIRRFDSQIGGIVTWSPFYGKINTFNAIFYFDWSFGVGLSSLSAESNIEQVTNTTANENILYTSESHLAALFKTALRLHATTYLHFDIEYLLTSYSADGPARAGEPRKSSLRTNSDLSLSVGLSF